MSAFTTRLCDMTALDLLTVGATVVIAYWLVLGLGFLIYWILEKFW